MIDLKWLEDYKRAVTRDGDVYRLKTSLPGVELFIVCKQSVNSDGYKQVRTSKSRGDKVHRLVATAFIDNPEGKPTVDHINRIRSDNRVDNLRWATMKEQSDNSARAEIPALYGCRKCEDFKKWNRNIKKKYYEEKRAQGLVYRKCEDGKRRWITP